MYTYNTVLNDLKKIFEKLKEFQLVLNVIENLAEMAETYYRYVTITTLTIHVY